MKKIEPLMQDIANAIRSVDKTTEPINAQDFPERITIIKREPSTHAYGIEWDTTVGNPDCTRIGNMDLHRALPVQSEMRRCLQKDDGSVNYYTDANDTTKKQDGTQAVLDGTDGQVMVAPPENFYARFETSGNKRRAWMSEVNIPGFFKVKSPYISAYEATLNRSTLQLSSVVNLSPTYRGGGNTAAEIAHDGDGGSSLGKPVTNATLGNFRGYARNRRSVNWNAYTYQSHWALFWLFAIEYATFNSQKPFNAQLTPEGFRQGGLGAGVSDLSSSNITNMTGSTQSCIPCGITNSLGNRTGVISYNMPPEYGLVKTTYVPSYRGIENPFGHLYKMIDGCKSLAYADSDRAVSEFYTCDNPADFSAVGIFGYNLRGLIPRSGGYIKEILFGASGEVMPKLIGGSSTTYFCDSFSALFPASGMSEYGFLVGGNSSSSVAAGFSYSYMYPIVNSYQSTTTRLTYIP